MKHSGLIPAAAAAAVVTALLVQRTAAQSPACSSTLSATYPAPSVAEGYVARLVANKLTSPRGIVFDDAGNLLVVQKEVGVLALTFSDDGGCVSESGRKTVIEDATLNHGIAINGSTLFASSSEAAYRWAYDASQRANTSKPEVLVNNMAGEDHTTRTLLVSKHAPGMLVVCRGSVSNVDAAASDIGTGHSQIKAYDLGAREEGKAYDYVDDGVLLGWGLRNEVGIDEEPITGGIYGVENSVDELMREGVDIHETNPAEELNFLGYLNGTASSNQGRNFGYPECFTAWNASNIPGFNGTVGEQFAMGTPNATVNDTSCSAESRQPPRLAFVPHQAPLDILFNEAGTAAWVTFHGSWNRDNPAGYHVAVVEFDGNGEPTEPSDSTTAAIPIVSNPDTTKCPDDCFRPVGLAWDRQGRLFFSSDSTGEIYVVTREDGSATSSAGSNATGTIPQPASPTSGAPAMTSSQAAAPVVGSGFGSLVLAIGFGVLGFIL